MFQIPDLTSMRVKRIPGNQDEGKENQSPVPVRPTIKINQNSLKFEDPKNTMILDKPRVTSRCLIAKFEKPKNTESQDKELEVTRGCKAYRCHICGLGGPDTNYSRILRHIAFIHYRDKLHEVFGGSKDKCSKCPQAFNTEQVTSMEPFIHRQSSVKNKPTRKYSKQ